MTNMTKKNEEKNLVSVMESEMTFETALDFIFFVMKSGIQNDLPHIATSLYCVQRVIA